MSENCHFRCDRSLATRLLTYRGQAPIKDVAMNLVLIILEFAVLLTIVLTRGRDGSET